MRFILALTAGIFVLAGSAAASTIIQFRTPSSNIGCAYSSGIAPHPELRCDILSGLKPPPTRPKGCDLDWTFGYEMNQTGRARKVCAGDTAVDRRSKALMYGNTWSHGGFRCKSTHAGLRCTNRSKHGFFLSREHSYRF